jgi:hypothetical protein
MHTEKLYIIHYTTTQRMNARLSFYRLLIGKQESCPLYAYLAGSHRKASTADWMAVAVNRTATNERVRGQGSGFSG